MINKFILFLLLGLGLAVIPGFSFAQTIDHCSGLDEDADATLIKNCQDKCVQQGGQWGGVIHGRGRSPGCNEPTKDAGKICEDSSQCEAGCVPGYDKVTQKPANTCAAYKYGKGHFIIRDKNGTHTEIME